MHDHATCEQLIAAAMRTGHNGRAEYLAARCDATHGRLSIDEADHTARTTHPARATEESA